MMEDFEKDIKEHFQQRQIKPSGNAWEKMEQMLNADKPVQQKTKTIYYMLSAAASVLLFIGLWIVFQKENQVQFPETKPTEQFVVNKPKDATPIKNEEEKKSVLIRDKELIVANKFPAKVHLTKSVSTEIVQNNRDQPKENEVGEVVQNHHIIQKSDQKIEEKVLAHQSKVEIKVNRERLLRSAEIERQIDNITTEEKSIRKDIVLWKLIKEKHNNFIGNFTNTVEIE
jgi:hypothetical protein